MVNLFNAKGLPVSPAYIATDHRALWGFGRAQNRGNQTFSLGKRTLGLFVLFSNIYRYATENPHATVMCRW